MKVPSYIPVDSLSKIDIVKSWDSDSPYENLGEISHKTMEKLSYLSDRGINEDLGELSYETLDRLSVLSNRGILAYSIGCAYWVIYRYSAKVDINVLLKYIEGCLPCLFAFSDRVPNELPQDEWKGPVRGPSQFSVFLIADTWHSGEFDIPTLQGVYSEKLVLYDIPKACNEMFLFLEWREVVLSRLEKDFQRLSDEPEGAGVPLEILDTGIELEQSEYRQAMLNAVSEIDKNNEFLSGLSDFDL
jgi:hypothetical protein